MLDKMTYVNSKGEKVVMGTGNILIGSNNVRDYEWSYTTLNEIISSFTRSSSKKKIPLIFYGNDCVELANGVYDVFIYDVVHSTPGKLYVGDYYIEGYFYASTKVAHKNTLIKETYNFVSTTGTWLKEKEYRFRYADDEESTGYLDFPYDFPFDYFVGGNANELTNESGVASDFLLTIYGKSGLSSINIAIGGQTYLLNASADDNEYIKIDSKNKTIVKTGTSGTETNMFNYRSRTHNIFQKIASGQNSVTWDDDFDFDLTLYEERSEPEWT